MNLHNWRSWWCSRQGVTTAVNVNTLFKAFLKDLQTWDYFLQLPKCQDFWNICVQIKGILLFLVFCLYNWYHPSHCVQQVLVAYICSLFNDAVSNLRLHGITWLDSSEKWIRKDMEGTCHVLIQGNMLAFVWRIWEIQRKLRIVWVLGKIQTGNPRNMCLLSHIHCTSGFRVYR